jgi:hypothetical protein
MARTLTWAAILALALSPGLATAQDGLSLRFADGRVTLVAKDAPLSRVLAEWQRLGGTRFVNTERLPGTPVTITLTDVPERQALAILLRPYSGYMVSPAPAGSRNASAIRAVLVMPTMARANPVPSPGGASAAAPQLPQQRPMNRGFGRPGIQVGGDPDADVSDPNMGTDPQDEPDAPPPGMMGMPNYPGMPTVPPQDPAADPSSGPPVVGRPQGIPGVPGTSTVPGMVVPATPTPGTGPPKLPPKPPGRDSAEPATRP